MNSTSSDDNPKSTGAQSMTESAPPPYPQEATPPAISPEYLLLRVGGWDIFHAGIDWPTGRERDSNPDSIAPCMFLALKPTAPLKPHSKKVSLIKLKIVEDNAIRYTSVPDALKSNPIKISCCETAGQPSEEALTLGAIDESSEVFLKIDHSYLDIEGLVYVFLELNKPQNHNQGHTRFHFHLVGKRFGRTRFSNLWFKFFSRSAVSKRVDNDRTMEAASQTMPFPCLDEDES